MNKGPFKMKAEKEGPMKKNFPSAFKKDDKDKLKDLVAKRKKLRLNEKKLSDGKTKILGNLRRKINKKNQEKNQDKINTNPVAIKNYQAGKKKEKKELYGREVKDQKLKNNFNKKIKKKKEVQGRRQS